jgi:RNA polymerase sigma-70 factor (ECF subfamily)
MPDEPEVSGLLALMLLHEARRPGRTAPDGSLLPLPEQDRSAWDADLIAEGHELVRRCLRRNRPGPYQLQAAIAAVHTDAPSAPETDWRSILELYDRLLAVTGSPVVAMNRVVALAEVDGPEAALAVLDELPVDRLHLAAAIRADLLHRLGRDAEALAAYEAAIAGTRNEAERAHLARRRDRLREGNPTT